MDPTKQSERGTEDRMERLLGRSGAAMRDAATSDGRIAAALKARARDGSQTGVRRSGNSANVVAIVPEAARASWQTVMVRRLLPIAASLLFIGLVAWFAYPRAPYGSVILHGGGSVASPAIGAGDRLVADKGPLLANIDGERVSVFLAAGSELQLEGPDRARLVRGSAWFSIEPQSGHYRLELPRSAVVVHGTAFAVDATVAADQVFLARGAVSVETASTRQTLNPHQSVTVPQGSTSPVAQTHPEEIPPSWADSLYRDYRSAYNSAYFPSLKQ